MLLLGELLKLKIWKIKGGCLDVLAKSQGDWVFQQQLNISSLKVDRRCVGFGGDSADPTFSLTQSDLANGPEFLNLLNVPLPF